MNDNDKQAERRDYEEMVNRATARADEMGRHLNNVGQKEACITMVILMYGFIRGLTPDVMQALQAIDGLASDCKRYLMIRAAIHGDVTTKESEPPAQPN